MSFRIHFTRTHRQFLALTLAVVLLAGLWWAVPMAAHAQGTAACPILIQMSDSLILRGAPVYAGTITATLVRGDVVCLVGRSNNTQFLQVSKNGTVVGWGPANAFWANVPFTVLPLTDGSVVTVPPTPVPPTVPPTTGQTYTVRAGDTVYSIAQRYGITIRVLMAANTSIPANYRIYTGQVLVIPGTTGPTTPTGYQRYTVQAGDYLVKIARQFNTTWYTLAQINGIVSPYTIVPSQQILVPVS